MSPKMSSVVIQISHLLQDMMRYYQAPLLEYRQNLNILATEHQMAHLRWKVLKTKWPIMWLVLLATVLYLYRHLILLFTGMFSFKKISASTLCRQMAIQGLTLYISRYYWLHSMKFILLLAALNVLRKQINEFKLCKGCSNQLIPT